MNTKEINRINNIETELNENDLEEVNGGLLLELAVAGAAVGAAAVGTAAVIGTAAALGTAAIAGAVMAEACRPQPRCYSYEYEYTYYRETGYRW
ncbi:MAG: hypothetical protein IKD72_03970 [Clostridia bacterium]|nr:hypothetical protein [Clostridia bacterium]